MVYLTWIEVYIMKLKEMKKEEKKQLLEFVNKNYDSLNDDDVLLSPKNAEFLTELRNVIEIVIKYSNYDDFYGEDYFDSEHYLGDDIGGQLDEIIDEYPEVYDEIKENGNQSKVTYDYNVDYTDSGKVLKHILKLVRKYYSYKNIEQKEFEASISAIIDKCPEVLYERYDGYESEIFDGQTLGMICAQYGFEGILLRCLDDKKAALQQDIEGYNIGMYAATFGLDKVVLKALENKELANQREANRGRTIAIMASVAAGKKQCPLLMEILNMPDICLQQDSFGRNIGIYAAISGLEDVVLKALDNPVLATQQDYAGMNIGMYSAKYGLKNAVKKALENGVVRKQKDKKGMTIEDILAEQNSKEEALEM